jgi:AraC family transcriptional regulator
MDHRTYVRGDVDVFVAGSTCAWHEAEPCESLMIWIPAARIEAMATELGRSSALQPRHKVRDPRIAQLAAVLATELADGNPNGPPFVDGVTTAIAARLVTTAAPRRTATLRGAQLDRVVRAIEDHLAEPISTAWLARHVAISTTHLKRLFAATFGIPIHAYVMLRRVERAHRLLAGDTHSLAEVAIAAGFAHQSHMARWMRRVHGTTPRAARHTAWTIR